MSKTRDIAHIMALVSIIFCYIVLFDNEKSEV